MSFYVQNNTPNYIWLAIAHYDPNCSPTTYVKKGWYRLVPGRSSLIVTGSSANQRYYYYAYDNSGNMWSGNYYTYIPNTAFDMCWVERCQGTGCNRVGFRELKVGNYQNYTLTFTNGINSSTKLRNTIVSKKGSPKFKLDRSSIRKSPGKVGKIGRLIKPLRGI
ncbi:DUF1036 domain-containing protein [Paenibacillus sp. Marseille-Q9583]